MIPGQFDYVRPPDLDETLRILQEREGEAELLSGGYSLLPMIKLRLAQPALLVDLRNVTGVDDIVLLDPVCGMIVDRAHARHLAEHEGVVYAFCAMGCRTSFIREPSAYLPASVSSAD